MGFVLISLVVNTELLCCINDLPMAEVLVSGAMCFVFIESHCSHHFIALAETFIYSHVDIT